MRLVAVVGCSLAVAFSAACGSEDPEMRPTASGTGGPAGGVAGKGGSTSGPSKDAGVPVGVYTEEVVESDPAPPPIGGGTLAIIAQGTKAAIADPDHDQVVVVDLASLSIAATIPLAPGDDPGRIVEDGAGRLHVALRAGRGVAVLDLTAGNFVRLPVCPLPRGLAYQYDSDTVHVACAGGELVSYTAANLQLARKVRLPRDLRDVVIDGARLLVSRFRSAELLVVESDGTLSNRLYPPAAHEPTSPNSFMKPAVAWRTVAAPGGGALMVHQYISMGPIATDEGGYGGRCRRILTTAVTLLRPSGDKWWTVDAIPTVLSVDVATTSDGRRVAVPGAGFTPLVNVIGSMSYAVFTPPESGPMTLSPCGGNAFPVPPFVDGAPMTQGRVVAVAFDPAGRLAAQTREPSTFHLGARSVLLPGRARKHTGHELFHLATVGGIACASCHPEGQDDGQVWNFADLGSRRTQSLAGGILGTEPFHWTGDMKDFGMLAADVFGQRMSGPLVQPSHTVSLLNWIDKIPPLLPPVASDEAAAARGQGLFNDPVVGCTSCHSGPRFTNNATVGVNTGGSFQVPSLLGLAWRAPYMHQGCAATLDDRFGPCGGGDDHGKTSQLTPAQRADLVVYLETL